MKNDLEDLLIYKKYYDLYLYTYQITDKYPKSEKACICMDIKNITYKGLVNIIEAQKQRDKYKRLESLNFLDANLKVLKVLVRISYKRKYICSRNYGAWSRKITIVGNLLGGWINSCLKQ